VDRVARSAMDLGDGCHNCGDGIVILVVEGLEKGAKASQSTGMGCCWIWAGLQGCQ